MIRMMLIIIIIIIITRGCQTPNGVVDEQRLNSYYFTTVLGWGDWVRISNLVFLTSDLRDAAVTQQLRPGREREKVREEA